CLARADEAKQWNHPQLRRSRRQNRRPSKQMVGQCLWMGIQPRQSCYRQAGKSKPCATRTGWFQQRAVVKWPAEVCRCLAQSDSCGKCEFARRERTGSISDDVRRRGLVRLAEFTLGCWRDGGLVLVDEERRFRPCPEKSMA